MMQMICASFERTTGQKCINKKCEFSPISSGFTPSLIVFSLRKLLLQTTFKFHENLALNVDYIANN